MNLQPTVSVILPNYNHAPFLKERIDSILAQTYQDFELILLDDCSTDNSVALLQTYADNPHVSALVCNEANTGNTFLQWDKGIRLARGRYIWIAESDDVAHPQFLEATVSALDARSDAVMCLTGSILIDDRSRPLKRPARDRWRETGEVKCFDGTDYVRHNLLYRNYVYNASMVVFRREVYGALDKSFQRLRCAGDWQFWAEVALAGRVLEVRRKLNRFRQHANKVSSRSKHTGEGVSDTIKVMRYLLQLVPVSAYKRCMVRGECYRIIRRSPAPKQVRAHLLAEARCTLGVHRRHYCLGCINRVLACVLPFLSTHRHDKLK